MNLSELIESKLAEYETEEDERLRQQETAEPDRRLVDQRGQVSPATLVRRAQAAGYRLSLAQLYKMVHEKPKTFPRDPDTVFALAAALQVTEGIVSAAILKDLGFNMYDQVFREDGQTVVVLAREDGPKARTAEQLDASRAAIVEAAKGKRPSR